MSANILLIDAERTTVARAMPVLAREGYHVVHALPGPEVLETLLTTHPDLVILSIEPHAIEPQASGWHFCRQIVACLKSPLLLLLPDSDEAARVRGLQMGADDCMTRPVQLLELVARVHALLRRSRCRTANSTPNHYVDGDLTIDLKHGRLILNGSNVRLTPGEVRLLACLIEHAGRPASIEHLFTAVWGASQPASPAAVRRYIICLRRKLETDAHHPCRLVTCRGQGYALRPSTPAA